MKEAEPPSLELGDREAKEIWGKKETHDVGCREFLRKNRLPVFFKMSLK
jgi:hypothetical protein